MNHPPAKNAKPTPENVHALKTWLDAITAYGVSTDDKPWLFYEQLDEYLGPWGANEYLIAYGKKYCKLFYEDYDLMHNRAGRAWVIRTLLLLQSALKDFVLERFTRGTLGSLTPGELKEVAFKSHAAAYTEAGLTMVCIISTMLVVHVVQIPGSEFLPWKPDAGRSWSQAFETGGIVAPQGLAMLETVLSLPAHSDIFSIAHHLDEMTNGRMYELSDALRNLRHLLNSGRLDHAGLLAEIEQRLEGARWFDHEMAEAASDVLTEVRMRHDRVSMRYEREIRRDDTLKAFYRTFDPRAF